MPVGIVSVIVLVLLQSWHMLQSLWYYVFAGIIAGAAASALIPKARLSKLFATPQGTLLPVSAVAGIVSPLCTYGTVPFFMGLLKHGMPIGPVGAFLAASAAINPQVIVLTAGTLGVRMAVGQVIAVFVMSLLVGAFASSSHQQKHADTEIAPSESGGKCHRHDKPGVKLSPWQEFWRNTLGISEHVFLYFLLGIIAANAVLVVTRGSFFYTLLGSSHWFAIPLAGLLAVPLYVCGGAMIPLLAVGSNLGMSQGAILAFLIIGPSTRIAPLVGMSAIFTKRAMVLYVIFVLGFAIACGFLYDLLLRIS